VTVDEHNPNNYCPATVHLTLKNGAVLSETQGFVRGGAEHPLTDDELLGKLASCLEAGGYGEERLLAERVWDRVMALDGEPGVSSWMERINEMVMFSKEQRHISRQGSNA
jgi:hypothetical protein